MRMRRLPALLPVLLVAVTVQTARAQMAHPAGMTHQQVVAEARRGAPRAISDSAAVAWIDSTKTVIPMQAGTNAFTCLIARPDFLGGPMCGDQHAMAWFGAVLRGQNPPTGNPPGVAYMARGGFHFLDPQGMMVFDSVPGARKVMEPPHWMLMYPFDAASGLPTTHRTSGAYIMFAGSPFAHLMIMEDPNRMPATSGRH